jgi:hypothetical protein
MLFLHRLEVANRGMYVKNNANGLKVYLALVLWIRGILVRIRIRGFMPLTIGSGSGSFYFRPCP